MTNTRPYGQLLNPLRPRSAACPRRCTNGCANTRLRGARDGVTTDERDDALMPQIEHVWQTNMQVYGTDKVWHQLNREDFLVARCTVQRLMKRQGLQGVRRGKVVRTAILDTTVPCSQDRVNRKFQDDRPNQLWVSDFTYVSTWQGWLYVAFVIDVFARRIVGWRVSSALRTDFVLDALEQALYDRQSEPSDDLIHHSDRGSQGAFNRSSQQLLPEDLRWEFRNTVAVGEASDLTLVLLGGRPPDLRGNDNASGLQLPVAFLPKLLQPLQACPQLSVRASSS